MDWDSFGGETEQLSSDLACAESGVSVLSTDCNDGDDSVSPAASELCNGLDDNGDGMNDEGFDANADGTADCLEEESEDTASDSGLKDERDGDLCGCGTEAPISALVLGVAGLGLVRRRRGR